MYMHLCMYFSYSQYWGIDGMDISKFLQIKPEQSAWIIRLEVTGKIGLKMKDNE